MLGPELELHISTPEQTLGSLSFSDHSPSAIKKWVKDLPMANVGELSRQLYQAIMELNKLVLTPVVRIQLLESLRPPIDYVCKELSKHFLNQSVVLTEKQQKIANLAQAIHIHLATGYKIVLADTIPDMLNEKTRKNFTFAAHRMLSIYGQVIMRSNQLYSFTPKNIWLESHCVFTFSEALDLLKYTVTDELNTLVSESRIDQIYKCNLLLSVCRPNQLRQNDIKMAYDAFQLWPDYVEIGPQINDGTIFIVSMNQDKPAHYKSLLSQALKEEDYGFDTTELVKQINHHINQAIKKSDEDTEQLKLPKNISDILLNHLNKSFGEITKRTFKRLNNNGELDLCIGLSAAHYFTSGKVEFHTQMLHNSAAKISSDDNIFLNQARARNDAWSEAADAGGRRATTPSDSPISFDRAPDSDNGDSYPNYSIPLVNTSPGGYCLQWPGEVPNNIQAGEIISLREDSKQAWSVAVIRWIRHIKQQGTQIGIELLAPNAQPCGVQLLQKTGNPSEYLRGMLLPELSSIGQASTLITPRLPFQSGQKVSIKFINSESKCQLESRISATGSFSQFELSKNSQIGHTLNESLLNKTNEYGVEDDFDSLWPSL